MKKQTQEILSIKFNLKKRKEEAFFYDYFHSHPVRDRTDTYRFLNNTASVYL